MPLSISNAAIQQFKAQFELNYQSENSLSGTTIELFNLRGDSYFMPFMGEGITSDRGAYQSLIASSDLSITRSEIKFSNWANLLPLDIYQEKELANGNTMGALSSVQSKAMARRVCQTKFDALAEDPGTSIVDGGTNMSVAKLREAKSAMDDANVPLGDRYICMTPSQIDSLLGDSSVTSILFNQQRTLVTGEIDTFLSFKFITIGQMAEGGLPKVGNIRSCFAWSKNSAATGFQIAPSVDIQWSTSHQSWLCCARLRLGAVVTQNPGVIQIDCDETA